MSKKGYKPVIMGSKYGFTYGSGVTHWETDFRFNVFCREQNLSKKHKRRFKDFYRWCNQVSITAAYAEFLRTRYRLKSVI